MTAEALRWVARIHGVVAWAAVVGLIAGAAGQRWRRASERALVLRAVVVALLLSGAFGIGLCLDMPYRARLRQQVFIDAPALGWLFERKLHLSFGAVMLSLCAAALIAAGAAAKRAGGDGAAPRADALVRGGHAALVASAVMAALAAVASAVVAHRHSF